MARCRDHGQEGVVPHQRRCPPRGMRLAATRQRRRAPVRAQRYCGCAATMNWKGVHILTLASAVVKPAADGQPSEDSATCARDTDPQEAGVLDRTRWVS